MAWACVWGLSNRCTYEVLIWWACVVRGYQNGLVVDVQTAEHVKCNSKWQTVVHGCSALSVGSGRQYFFFTVLSQWFSSYFFFFHVLAVATYQFDACIGDWHMCILVNDFLWDCTHRVWQILGWRLGIADYQNSPMGIQSGAWMCMIMNVNGVVIMLMGQLLISSEWAHLWKLCLVGIWGTTLQIK